MSRPKVSVFLGLSLDGYIAGEGGNLSWLATYPELSPDETGYTALFSEIDVLVIGRHTYEVCLGFESWPYASKRVVVMTHRLINPVRNEEAYAGPLGDLLGLLHLQGARHVYLDGGVLVREGLSSGVVDELTLTWVPVILGQGIPLFTPELPFSRWRLGNARSFQGGAVQCRYYPASAE